METHHYQFEFKGKLVAEYHCITREQGELLYFRDFSGYIKRVISKADFLGDADTEKYKKAVKQYATI